MKRLTAILILMAVVACTPYWAKDRQVKFAKCPDVRLLEPARGWIDPAGNNWRVRGEIVEFSTECKIDKDKLTLTITPSLQIERTMADKEEVIKLPIFFAVTKQDVISKKVTTIQSITFGEGKKQFEDDVTIPIEFSLAANGGTLADRTILIGLQLSPEQQKYFETLRTPPEIKP